MNYKALLVIPILFLIVASGLLFAMSSSGELNLDIDFSGGTQLTAETEKPIQAENIENLLKDYEPKVRTGRGFNTYSVIIDLPSEVSTTDIINVLKSNGYDFDYSVQTISPVLGESFFQQARLALILAFIFMAIVIFFIFKQPLPSFYIVLCAVANIVETLVISQLLGIKLSLATFAALLLILGYSVDSDILLTTRVLKRQGELKDKLRNAFKTTITMTITTLAAMLALYFVSTSQVIVQIASILIIALLLDVMNTWLLNAGLLRWYVERKIV